MLLHLFRRPKYIHQYFFVSEFLREIAEDPLLRANVIGIWEIEPLPCVGMESDREKDITKAATLLVTFRENGIVCFFASFDV